MKEYQSLSHTRWDCKYHVVFIPKRRKKAIYGALRKHLGEIFRELAQQRQCQVVEGHLMIDHVHKCLSVPPKYSVSNVVGFIKGKSAISIARHFGGRQRNFTGEVFWVRAYFVSRVGLDEEMVRAYIRNQEQEMIVTIKCCGTVAAFRRITGYQRLRGTPAINLRLCRR